MNKKWTPAEEEFIVKQRDRGVPVADIAASLGRSVKSLYNKYSRLKETTINRWSFEEEERLIDLKNIGKSEKEIATILKRTCKSINNKANELISYGRLLPKVRIFDIEEDYKIVSLRDSGYSLEFIAEYLGYSTRTISKRLTYLLATNKVTRLNKVWTNEELLEAVKEFPTVSSLFEKASEDRSYPYPERVRLRFGSWNAAKLLLGLNICSYNGLKPDMPTILYLVKFRDFYKIGITQRTIKQRFFSYPKYEIVDHMTLDLEAALEIEKELLSLVSNYKVIPEDFKEGKTECFQINKELNSLEDLYELH